MLQHISMVLNTCFRSNPLNLATTWTMLLTENFSMCKPFRVATRAVFPRKLIQVIYCKIGFVSFVYKFVHPMNSSVVYWTSCHQRQGFRVTKLIHNQTWRWNLRAYFLNLLYYIWQFMPLSLIATQYTYCQNWWSKLRW